MKTTRTLATVLLAAFLVLGPVAALGATSTMTLQTNASSYSSGQSVTVSGTITPAPTIASAVVVTTFGPNGVADTGTAAVQTGTGTFSYTFVAGGSMYWATGGTFTITGMWGAQGNTATATTTFTYAAGGTGGGESQP